MMKKTLYYLTMCMVVSILAVSCETEPISFDESFLIGKWQSGTLFYKYLNNGTGGTWDTGDNVFEEEAQAFTWTLINAELTQIHIMEIGGAGIPKIYTVTELTATSLKYHDDFASFSFTKVGI